MTFSQNFSIKKERKKCKIAEDLTGKNSLLQCLLVGMLRQLLQNEMEEYLAYEKYSSKREHSGNSWKDKTKKTVKSTYGNVALEIFKDRNRDFELIAGKKQQRNTSSFDDKIISMYAKGMRVRDIQSHDQEIYGVNGFPTLIANMTEKVMESVT